MTSIERIETVAAMKARSCGLRAAGRRIAFVPTMGFLHEGHLSLLRAAKAAGDVVVLSIFVNPTQFGPNEDLSRYPRSLERDLALAADAGTAIAFLPTSLEMYPPGYQTYVEVRELERGLCGDKRPGHFVGVASVVCKLFNIVRPDVAFFGEKDFQQLAVIRRMASDLDLDVEVVGMPIVREADGLAMSSRNAYLSPEQRQAALALSKAVFAVRDAFARGERHVAKLLAVATDQLRSDAIRVDYAELRDAEALTDLTELVERDAVFAVAAFVGTTRLIDNIVLRAYSRSQP